MLHTCYSLLQFRQRCDDHSTYKCKQFYITCLSTHYPDVFLQKPDGRYFSHACRQHSSRASSRAGSSLASSGHSKFNPLSSRGSRSFLGSKSNFTSSRKNLASDSMRFQKPTAVVSPSLSLPPPYLHAHEHKYKQGEIFFSLVPRGVPSHICCFQTIQLGPENEAILHWYFDGSAFRATCFHLCSYKRLLACKV